MLKPFLNMFKINMTMENNEAILNEEIRKIIVFVEMTNGNVRQVVSTHGVKDIAIKFIAKQNVDGILRLGSVENVKFDEFNYKEVEE